MLLTRKAASDIVNELQYLMNEDTKEGRVVTGEIVEALPSLKFKVRLEDGTIVLAYLAGKLRMFKIRVLPGDKVNVMMSPYDNTRGRIVYRNK